MNERELYAGTFKWLAIGVLISFLCGFVIEMSGLLTTTAANALYIIAAVIQLVIAFAFGLTIKKVEYTTCLAFYILYCVLTGFDIAVILIAFEVTDILFILLITSILFGLMAFAGTRLNIDVSNLGNILLFSLIALVIVSIICAIIGVDSIWLIVISLAIFLIYIIYDTKIIVPLANEIGDKKATIYCAFELYLDFINIFIDLLKIYSRNRD